MNNKSLSRRDLLKQIGIGAAALAAQPLTKFVSAAEPPATDGPTGFRLPPLPYAYDALEPHLDAETMRLHHGKHHQAYVTNLNAALKDHPDLLAKPIEQLLRDLPTLPATVRTAVRNHGGGHYNHMLFWTCMKPNGGGEPTGKLATAIAGQFGSFAAFKEQFNTAATKQFGSGWAWLVKDTAGALKITTTGNQDSPVTDGLVPLLGLDVWEHAYYLRFQNRRAEFVAAWWNVVNWDAVNLGFER
jgi:Fe-Mn family superoxide dismutase